MPHELLEKAKTIRLGDARWHLLLDAALDGAANMNRDTLLLRRAQAQPDVLPALRFFQWQPPAVSIGYAQPLMQIDDDKCAALGIPVVRRPTGGRAIYHHSEFTYSVTIPPWHPLARLRVLETYNKISMALKFGLRNIGINAKLSRGDARLGGKNPSCFSSTARYELAVGGKKLVGSAQRRSHGAILQQGSIIAGPEYMLIAELVSRDGEIIRQDLEQHSTYILAVLGRIPTHDEFSAAMVAGFEEAFAE